MVVYATLCAIHGKKVDPVNNRCPDGPSGGHIATKTKRSGPLPDPEPDDEDEPMRTGVGVHMDPLIADAQAQAKNVDPRLKNPVLRPQRFIDDDRRLMTLTLKETRSCGWAIHCKIQVPSELDPKKLVVKQQGLARVFGGDQAGAAQSLQDLCTSSKKAGWRDAPQRNVRLIEVPQPVVKPKR